MGEKLNDLLSRFFSEEGITEEEFAQLEKGYGSAINESPCPCESGKKFIDCCKPTWNAALRSKNTTEKNEKEEVKQTKRDGKRVRADQPQWILKVGIEVDGGLTIVPLDGVQKEIKGIALMNFLAGILCSAYHTAMVDTIQASINSGCSQVVRHLTRPPTEGQSEGGIIVPH